MTIRDSWDKFGCMTTEYTVKQVADALGVSHNTVSRWINLGLIQARQHGLFPGKTSKFFISQKEFDRLKKLQADKNK